MATRGRTFTALLVALGLSVVAAACTSGDDSGGASGTGASGTGATATVASSGLTADGKVIFAGFNFTESTILANIYAQAAIAAGVPAEVKANVGPREVVYRLLFKGELGVVPEYSGSAVVQLGGEASADADATHATMAELMGENDIDVLDGAEAANHDAVAVTLDTATRLDLRTMSDLAAHADDLTLGGPAECPHRPLCIPGLTATYAITFKGFVPLDPGLDTASSLAQNQIDAGLVFTTDATLSVFTLVLLDDDKGLYPAENVTPVVRQDVLEKYPDLAKALDAVSAELTTRELRALNYTVAIAGERPAEAARNWLQDHGLIPAD